MLRPQDGPTRERKSLNGLWRFRLDPAGDGPGRPAGGGRRCADARDMPVPASYNDIPADAAVRDHVGDAWYQTTVRVPRGWAGQRVVLRFDAATHRAVVWVDDVEVAAHEGGYTPFEADVTAHVRPGEEVRVTVVVDNRLTWQSIPPGIVENGTADLLPRLLQLRRPAPVGVAVQHPAGAHRRHHRRPRPGRDDRHRRLPGRDDGRRLGAGRAARRRGRRGRRRGRRRRAR